MGDQIGSRIRRAGGHSNRLTGLLAGVPECGADRPKSASPCAHRVLWPGGKVVSLPQRHMSCGMTSVVVFFKARTAKPQSIVVPNLERSPSGTRNFGLVSEGQWRQVNGPGPAKGGDWNRSLSGTDLGV